MQSKRVQQILAAHQAGQISGCRAGKILNKLESEPMSDLLRPDLTAIPAATPLDRKFAAEYTRIRPVVVAGGGVPHAHNVWLVLRARPFQLNGYFNSAEEASWMCFQLARALQSVPKQESRQGATNV